MNISESYIGTGGCPVRRNAAFPPFRSLRPSDAGFKLANSFKGTDLHEYSTPTFIPQPGSPHPVTGEVMPVGVGHEFSGTVLEIGKNADLKFAKGLKVGGEVACQPTICCSKGGKCQPCGEGHINSCDKGGFVGLSGGGGGMSDAVCIEGEFVFGLPDGVGLDVGALVEPLAVAWHAVDQFEIKKGDMALVMG